MGRAATDIRSRANCLIIRHSANQGVAAAMMTGMRAAGTEIVCSMDCDCTYDPHELGLDDPPAR